MGPVASPPLSLRCPPARARGARPGDDHGCPGVQWVWVGEYPDELQDCTCPCHRPA